MTTKKDYTQSESVTRERTVNEVMTELEKAVKAAQLAQATADTKQAEYVNANKEAVSALGEVDKLKEELNERLGNIFPQSARVRLAS